MLLSTASERPSLGEPLVVAETFDYHDKPTARLRNETRGTWSQYLSDDDRAAFVDSLRSAVRRSGRYLMPCFSDQQPGSQGPRQMTRGEIGAAFTDGWRIDSLQPATIDITTDPDGIRAWLVALTRT